MHIDSHEYNVILQSDIVFFFFFFYVRFYKDRKAENSSLSTDYSVILKQEFTSPLNHIARIIPTDFRINEANTSDACFSPK